MLIISLGYVFVVTSMQAGSVIGVSLSFSSMVWAVLVSSAILTVLSCIMGVIAAKSGLTSVSMARYSFGQVGHMGAGADRGYHHHRLVLHRRLPHRRLRAPSLLLDAHDPHLHPRRYRMTITASKGTKWMNMLSNIAVPIVLIFGFISIIRAFNDVGGVAGINALVKEDSITFAKAVALGVGSYVVGSVMFTPDICALPRMQRPPSLL